MKLPLHVWWNSKRDTSGDFDRKAIVLGYSIDSRTVRAGEVFFAVRARRWTGMTLFAQTLEKGAVCGCRFQIRAQPV